MEWIQSPQAWIGLATLSLLEIVLGIDNLIFISILSGKLPPEQRDKARKMGLSLALITRILLLCSLSWVMSLSNQLWNISILGLPLPNTGKDLVLAFGGLFLIWKSTKEIHEKVEGHAESTSQLKAPSFASVIVQILLLDIVFSLDSVITAVGMSNQIPVMIAAVVLAMLVMLLFVNQIGAFVEKYPTIKVLALAFLILIGTMLLAEGFQQHISKGYIYFAMAFSIAVEVINIRVRSKSN
ncbi:MAG: TerC family protein [Verrucomicrobia bacterium]|jgi:predicted tellurium resistance membrane protein TerC|nr:TerC family protein [Verrucomicrobiota bacterium]